METTAGARGRGRTVGGEGVSEADNPPMSSYYIKGWIQKAVSEGRHREVIGGRWDEIGTLQRDFLIDHGLQPQHTLLDIGCGSLRLGQKIVAYLYPGNYWGTDLSSDLLEVGYTHEIVGHGLDSRLDRDHLIVDGEFRFSGVPGHVDMAIAQSVFTHLPCDYLRLCLQRLGAHCTGACTFYFTVFMPAPGQDPSKACQQDDGFSSFPDRDPFHYTHEDLLRAAERLPWEITVIGEWNHPRNQKMICARKTAQTLS